MNWKEDYAKEAMQDGRHAARTGKGENPFPAGSFEAAAWAQGADSVERMKKKEKEDAS